MTTINGPILKAIAKIQSGIGLPPSKDGSGYDRCQAYTINAEPCKRRFGKKQQQLVANLLTEFRHVTDYDEIEQFYDKMAKFFEKTYCHSHGGGALRAFSKWKTERIASASSSLSTLATNANFSSDSLETSSETSSVASPAHSSPVPGSSECILSASDLHLEAAMRNLVLDNNSRKTATRKNNDEVNQMKRIRNELKRLGNVELPDEGAQQKDFEIFETINDPPHPRRMSDGIIYIYKHINISGIFKIGYTKKSAIRRQRQSGNCYGIDTEIIYSTDQPFSGAYQAERISHAVLKHKKVSIYNCPHCGGEHREWFLAPRKEVLEVVKCAESWLRMPAYTFSQGRFKLSAKAEVIYGSLFGFSLTAMKQQKEEILPIRRAESALNTMDPDEIEELKRVRVHPLRPTLLDGDEDYSDGEEPQESDSDEDYSEDEESQELDGDEDNDEEDEEELDEECSGAEESQELDSDEQHSESEETEALYSDEDDNQAEGSLVSIRGKRSGNTRDVDMNLVRMLKAIHQGGASEFRIIFPPQAL